MDRAIIRFRQGIPDQFLAALAVGLGFMIFLVIDQMHWWQLKPDYTFGWLVPVFVIFIVYDRWSRLRSLLTEGSTGSRPLAPAGWTDRLAPILAVSALAVGSGIFLLGALYKAGSGPTQPGSFALAFGFSLILPALVYLSLPAARDAGTASNVPSQSSGGAFWQEPRLRVAALFLFPAGIWLISAPLVTAVENSISLFLLRRVVTVVFTVFDGLGYPMIQEGNVLVLPRGRVGVVEACSGIRSLMGCLFAGSFLAAAYLDQFWKKVILVGMALVLAFAANLLRSLFLTGWAYAYGSEAIEGDIHDWTGLAVLGVTVAGLFSLLPFFNAKTWVKIGRWLKGPDKARAVSQRSDIPAASAQPPANRALSGRASVGTTSSSDPANVG